MKNNHSILIIVNDAINPLGEEASIRTSDFRIEIESDRDSALEQFRKKKIRCVLYQQKLSDNDDLFYIEKLISASKGRPLILILEQDEIARGVDCINLGASDVISRDEFEKIDQEFYIAKIIARSKVSISLPTFRWSVQLNENSDLEKRKSHRR